MKRESKGKTNSKPGPILADEHGTPIVINVSCDRRAQITQHLLMVIILLNMDDSNNESQTIERRLEKKGPQG
jgi:hypothetical protein